MNANTGQMKAHPAADLFPMLTGEAYERFRADVKEHGQREPIVVHENLILDGRNRWRACADLGLTPQTRKWDGKGSPVALVLSLNLHRRHLDESQRGMVAARALPMFAEEARARMEAGKAADPSPNLGQGKAAAQAAAAVNVSRGTVENAAKVLRQGTPELVEAVDRGEVKVSAAAQVVKLPAGAQRAAIEGGRVAEVAKELRRHDPPKLAEGPSDPHDAALDRILSAPFPIEKETKRLTDVINRTIRTWPRKYRPQLAQLLREAAERAERWTTHSTDTKSEESNGRASDSGRRKKSRGRSTTQARRGS